MSRYRRKRSGGGGRIQGISNSKWLPFMGLILGGIALFFTLIAFGIALAQWDDAYTTAATYTQFTGVTDIMGIIPLILFVLFQGVGVAVLVGTSVIQFKAAAGGGMMEMFLAIIFAAVGIIIAVIVWDLNQTQLNTVYDAANTTNCVNSAAFTGLQDIMTAWGIIDLLAILSPALSAIAGIGVGGYRRARGVF